MKENPDSPPDQKGQAGINFDPIKAFLEKHWKPDLPSWSKILRILGK